MSRVRLHKTTLLNAGRLYKKMRNKEDFAKQNEYNRAKYDRIGLMLPKGNGNIWKQEAKKRGMSLNELVKEAVNEYISKTK